MNVLLILLLCFVPMSVGARKKSTRAPAAARACPRFPPLLHGYMNVRQQGRRVRFLCKYPFYLVGSRYSTCGVDGWDHPAPICVSPSSGCPVPSVANGMVLPLHNNAWVDFFCQPGFQVVGSPALYCDGASWNGTAPTCVAVTTEVQLSCDFERDLCGWRQDETHDFDWTRHNRETPSSFAFTGPSYDHTLGISGAGYYMYIESSSRRNNESARLMSPIFSSHLAQDGCFSFFYHMYGHSIGGLRVFQIPILQMELSEIERQDYLLFEKWGNLGDTWFGNVSRLRNTNSNFQIVIEGIRGTSFTSDVAIDDVAILQGNQCNDASITAVTPPDLALETCRGWCEVARPPPHRAGCRCTIDCVSNETCCPDYLELCIFNTPPPITTTTTTSTTTTTTTTTTPSTTTTPLTTTTRSTTTSPSTTTTLSTTTTTMTTGPRTTTDEYINWTTETEPAWTTATWSEWSDFEDTSEVDDHEGSTISETTGSWSFYDTVATSPETTTSNASSPPARNETGAPTPQTTKPPTATTTTTSPSTSTSTISTTTMEQGTGSDYDDTTTQTSPSTSTSTTTMEQETGSDYDDTTTQTAPGMPVSPKVHGNEYENLKKNASGSSATLVMVLVPIICLVIVGLVILLTLRSYKTIYYKVRRLHPFHFRATFTPNSRDGNNSEIPIFEFGNRSPGENACTLRENSFEDQ